MSVKVSILIDLNTIMPESVVAEHPDFNEDEYSVEPNENGGLDYLKNSFITGFDEWAHSQGLSLSEAEDFKNELTFGDTLELTPKGYTGIATFTNESMIPGFIEFGKEHGLTITIVS